MGKFDEVVYNLKFAKELERTLGALTQDVRFYINIFVNNI